MVKVAQENYGKVQKFIFKDLLVYIKNTGYIEA